VEGVEAKKTLEALQRSAKIARKEILDDGLLRRFLDKYLELEELLKNGDGREGPGTKVS